jgi:GNAT superfamily N-acetyltransferase
VLPRRKFGTSPKQVKSGADGPNFDFTGWISTINFGVGYDMTSSTSHADYWKPRLASEKDIAELEALIPVSVRALQAALYSSAQMEAALGTVFAVDGQLIRDGTYFVVEDQGRIVGCGGWSFRRSQYGGDQGRKAEDLRLDPASDAARVRAFFVHPSWARRGIGRSIMDACEMAIAGAGFRKIEIVATLAGEPLYASFGCGVVERFEIPMANGLRLPVVRMTKDLG